MSLFSGLFKSNKPAKRFPISEITGKKFSLSNERDSRGIQIESDKGNSPLFVGYSPRSRFVLGISMAIYIAKMENDKKKIRNDLDILMYAIKECGSPVNVNVDEVKSKMMISPNWKNLLVYAKAVAKLLNKHEEFDMKQVSEEVFYIFTKEDTLLHSDSK